MTSKFIRTILSCTTAPTPPPPHPTPTPLPSASPPGTFSVSHVGVQQGKRCTLITDNYFRHHICLWHAVIAATPRSLSGYTSIKHAGYQINLIALCHKSATSKASSGYFCCCMLVIFVYARTRRSPLVNLCSTNNYTFGGACHYLHVVRSCVSFKIKPFIYSYFLL